MKTILNYLLGTALVVLLALAFYQTVIGPSLVGLTSSTADQIRKAGGRNR